MCRKTVLERMYETSLWICKGWPKSQLTHLFLPVLRWNGNSVPMSTRLCTLVVQLITAGFVNAPTPSRGWDSTETAPGLTLEVWDKSEERVAVLAEIMPFLSLPHSALALNFYFNLISVKAFTTSLPYLPNLGILWKKAHSASKNFQSPLLP